MRFTTLVRCSASFGVMALLATPAYAQTQPQPEPEAAQTTPADTTGEEQQVGPEAEEEEIVVTGIRGSLRSAQNIRRNSDQIVDAVVAEDIGKLPDINVSESLARITGVQIDRAQGEGAGVSIRGLRDATTTYNGREIFTAEARNVATQDFPAGGVAALEVFKSTTAEQVEAGIAGLINVRSRRPFDFSGREISGSLNVTYADQSQSTNWNGNLLFSDRWETSAGEWGALINFSYTSLDYLDSARFNSGDIRTSPAGFRYPGAIGIFYGAGRRERPSLNAALQFRPNDNIEFYVDALYQGFRRERDDRIFDVNLRDAIFSNVVLVPGTNEAQSLSAATVNRIFRFQGAPTDKTDTYQVAAGAIYTADRLRIAVDLASTHSRYDLSVISFDSLSNVNPAVNVNFDVPREYGGVEFSLPGFDPNDPNNYVFGGLFEREFYASGSDIQARIDATYETGLPVISRLQAGLRYVGRNGERADGARFTPGSGPLTAVPVELYITPAGFRGSDVQPLRTWVTPTFESLRGNLDALRTYVGAPGEDPVPVINLRVNEVSYAAYGQLHYEFPLGDFGEVDGTVGLRAVTTEFNFINEPVTEYTDYLPNVSTRIRFLEDFVLRAAFTQTRTRPAFEQLAPTRLDPPQPGQPFRTGGGGNPDLQPVQSDNYDLALEYYFSRTGFATVALFRRDIVGFITNLARTIQDPVLGELRLNRPENGGEGRLEGIEAQLTTFFDFDFLPEWAHGFGIQANYTFIDASQAFPLSFGAPLTARFDIPNVSRHTYNFAAFYENDVVSARLAYNRRTRFVNSFDNAQQGVLSGEYTDDTSRLDFSASFTPFENITFAVDVSNILGEPFQNFRNYTNEGDIYPRDVRYEERVFSVGVRFRL